MMDVVKRDLKDMSITWEEAEELATDKSGCGVNLSPNELIWMRDHRMN